MVEQLRGKKFSGSDVEKRVEKAVTEDPKKPGTYTHAHYKSIPFELTLEQRGQNQVLVPTSKGPAKPESRGSANKVSSNTTLIETMPNEAITEDITSLFNVKTFPSVETEDQVTALVVDAETKDGEKMK